MCSSTMRWCAIMRQAYTSPWIVPVDHISPMSDMKMQAPQAIAMVETEPCETKKQPDSPTKRQQYQCIQCIVDE